MTGDCHIHMVLDGVNYRTAIDRQKEQPDEALIRSRLADYRERGITYLRDGGDAWQVSVLASRLAEEYGIIYRTPAFPICRRGHYGSFIGKTFENLQEYKELVSQVKLQGGHFIKLMLSGIMDFGCFGRITDVPCEPEQITDLVALAHDAGFSVMAHVNGAQTIAAALQAGVDSVEHGAHMEDETLHQLGESSSVWVPTVLPVAVHCGRGAFPDAVLNPLVQLQLKNIRKAASYGAQVALGTDAGAALVHHGTAVAEEYALLRQALGDNTDRILQAGENAVRCKF